MGRKWTDSEIVDGVGEFTLTSWNYFSDFIDKEMLDFRQYIYRGQQYESWLLEPTLNRLVAAKTITKLNQVRKEHLEKFRYALRGRVPDSNKYNKDDELWALGQHHGLATPLLDWTHSPYVAAYFAFFEAGGTNKDYRVVYVLDQSIISVIKEISIVNPITDDNKRLINQSGLFVKQVTNLDLEAVIKEKYKGVTDEYRLIKVRIPNKNREIALRSLNRMNINHNTLFPDIEGASIYCNTDVEIDKY